MKKKEISKLIKIYFEKTDDEIEFITLDDIMELVNENEEDLTFRIVKLDKDYRIAIFLGDCLLVDVDKIKFSDQLYSKAKVVNLIYKLYLKSFNFKFC